ncbi:hypothetical protein Dimus_037307, partial [Dionaea muscipula]
MPACAVLAGGLLVMKTCCPHYSREGRATPASTTRRSLLVGCAARCSPLRGWVLAGCTARVVPLLAALRCSRACFSGEEE